MATNKMDALVHEAIEETFPASDPPSYMAGAAVLGSPSHAGLVREPPFTGAPNAGDNSREDKERRTHERA